MSIKQLKPEVQRLYLQGKDVPEICEMFKINPSTIYQWIKKDGWKTMRDSKMKKFIKSPEILMEMLETTINGLNQEQLLDPSAVAKVADSVSKIVKSIKNLSKDKDRLGSVLFVVGELGKHMNDNESNYIYDEDFRNKFDKLLSGFQSKMLLKYSVKNYN